MRKIMGIDTGGTYTDGVIIRADDRRILAKTKTLTTRHSLQMCIKNCMEAFSAEELAGVELVCLSTTLATNAVVEGRGCQEGLLLIGGRPEGRMPTSRYRVVQGRPDIMGRMRERIDPAEVDAAIEAFRGKVDAIAVSGYASVRNPAHEIYVKERIREKLGVPVVCAHELTASLGFYERTVTADLNAKLIPLICNLLDSVKRAMEKCRVRAPLMIVKGDGTLMTEACARDKPIETILSGPAASVIGGVFLSGLPDAIVLDMGGTTADLASVTGGSLRMNNEGASVGGWLTRIRAAEIYTVGLGGDSRVCLSGSREVCIGPQKVIPYCVGAAWFPALEQELREISRAEGGPHRHFHRNEGEAYLLTRYGDFSARAPAERQVLEAIRRTPHTLYTLHRQCRLANLAGILEKLMADDLVARIALTPTDILHARGAYTAWNAAASRLAVQMMADALGLSPEGCVHRVQQAMARQLTRACIQSSLYGDRADFDARTADYFINFVALDDGSSVLRGTYSLKKPVVAIGAPARAWVGCLEQTLYAQVVFPAHAEVANAVGAAVGQAAERAEVLIRRDAVTGSYTVFSSECRQSFPTLEEATEAAKALGRRCASARLPGLAFDVADEIEDIFTQDHFSGEKQFVERQVHVTAVSHLSGDRRNPCAE